MLTGPYKTVLLINAENLTSNFYVDFTVLHSVNEILIFLYSCVPSVKHYLDDRGSNQEVQPHHSKLHSYEWVLHCHLI